MIEPQDTHQGPNRAMLNKQQHTENQGAASYHGLGPVDRRPDGEVRRLDQQRSRDPRLKL